jgi:ATP-dependent DNA ligase
VVAKRLDSIYEPGKRSGAWQKHKTQPSEDFVIGYSAGNESVDQIAVGEFKNGKLLFVEAVKNGFVPSTLLSAHL